MKISIGTGKMMSNKTHTMLSIKEYILYNTPPAIFKILMGIYIRYKKRRMPEQRKSFGELNPDKTFFVIRIYPPGSGFGAMYLYVLGYIKYALEKEWIPVVDMQNYETLYSDPEGYNNSNNVWEYFFCQPLDRKTKKRYSLDEVYHSKNVILSDGTMASAYCGDGEKETVLWQHEISELVPFNQKMQEHVGKEYTLLERSTKILGVAMREGGRARKTPYGHEIAPKREEMIQMARERMKKWDMKELFVTSEEEGCIESFISAFGQILYVNRRRMKPQEAESDQSLDGAYLPDISVAEHVRDYLTEIYLLSKCDCLVGMKTNGLLLAQIWNGGKYQHYEYVKTGVYKVRK